MSYIPEAGDRVLIFGTVTNDARQVRVGPGVELPVSSVHVVSDVPERVAKVTRSILLFFACDDDVEDFIRSFTGAYPDGVAHPVDGL